MPDLEEPTLGLQAEATPESVTSEAQTTGDEPEVYLHTWKTKEDAQKGVEDLQRIMSQMQSERDKAQSELKKTQDEFLSKLTDAVTTQKSGPTEPQRSQTQVREEIERLAKDIDDGGGEAILRVMNAYIQDSEQTLGQRHEQQLKELQKQYGEQIAKLSNAVQEYDPEYRAVGKEKVAKIMEEFGCDRTMAVNIAKKYETSVQQPSRPPIPGTTATEGVTLADENSTITQETVNLLQSSPLIGNLSDAEKKALARRRK